MKKLILCLMFFANVSFASPDWPSQLFSIDQIYQIWMLKFQNYFRDINRNYVVNNLSPDRRVITSSKYPQYFFKINIQRSIKESSITEVINYTVRDFPAGNLTIIRSGRNLSPIPNEDLFNFRLPLPSSAEKFQLYFDGEINIRMNFSNTGKTQAGILKIFNGEVTINFSEQEKDENYLTRSLWYICKNCSDSMALIANAQKTGEETWQYLYKTSKGEVLTSQDFYFMWQSYYFPPIEQAFESSFQKVLDLYDWP